SGLQPDPHISDPDHRDHQENHQEDGKQTVKQSLIRARSRMGRVGGHLCSLKELDDPIPNPNQHGDDLRENPENH
ncbi:MAG TPA: hypothetical protein PKE45_17325, partial [Caldilineaceae bacterium]|nr:hypothetical protein [Caldilineaceae bacterium]